MKAERVEFQNSIKALQKDVNNLNRRPNIFGFIGQILPAVTSIAAAVLKK